MFSFPPAPFSPAVLFRNSLLGEKNGAAPSAAAAAPLSAFSRLFPSAPPSRLLPQRPTRLQLPAGPARTTAPSSPRAAARPTSGGAGRARAWDGGGGGGAAVSAGRELPPLSPSAPGPFPALSSVPGRRGAGPGSPRCVLELGARPGAGFGAWGGAPEGAGPWAGGRGRQLGGEQRPAP